MNRPEVGDDARVHNESSVTGTSVQAGAIHGDVHFHGAGNDKPVVPRQLPVATRHFVNRAVEQDVLTTVLNGASSEPVVLISTIDGVAGVGKSTLAVHWAHRMRDRFPDGELYVNLRGFDPAAEPMPAAEALAGFLAALAVPAERIPEGLDARAALFRSLLHNKRLLILLDNARSSDQIRPLLPGSSSCVVLVTSRNRLDDLVIREGAARISLKVLTRDEAYDLLRRYLGDDRLAAEPSAVNDLIAHCAGLPLALGIVAFRAAELPDYPLDDLLAQLQDERDRLDILDSGGETGIRAVFSWSYRLLSPGAARMFRLLGLPTGPDISLAAAADLAGVAHREARQLLDELRRANLLEQHVAGRFRFHDLLRAYAAECAARDETAAARQAAVHRLFDHYVRTSYGIYLQQTRDAHPIPIEPPPSTIKGLSFSREQEALSWWEVEEGNLIAAIVQCPRWSLHVHTYQLALPLVHWFLYKPRRYVDNLPALYKDALDSARTVGDRHAEAFVLTVLASIHYARDEFAEGIPYSEQAAVAFHAVGDHYWDASTRIELGVCLARLQRYDEAMHPILDGLELMEIGGDVDGKAYGYQALGIVYAGLGRFDEAFVQFHEALRLYRDLGAERGAGYVLNSLADSYAAAGRLDDAIDAYRAAAAHRREIGHRQGEAESLRGLGAVLRESGDPDGAREAWRQALAIFEDLADPAAESLREQFG
jgi:tetratricopeptide (TPR) repeat protein